MGIIDVCNSISESFELQYSGKCSDFSSSFNAFNESSFGRFRDTSVLQWINNILDKGDEGIEGIKEIFMCLQKIQANEFIDSGLYRVAMTNAKRFREEQKEFEVFNLSYLIQSTIVDSLCGRIFNGALNDTMEKKEIKEYEDNLKAIKNEIQLNNEYCSKFIEQLSVQYEKLNAKGSVLSIEFAAFFFKSLTTLLVNELDASGKVGSEELNEKIPLLESCVELRRTFVVSCIMMIAIRYLQTRTKTYCNDSTDCSIAPPRYEDLHAVRLLKYQNANYNDNKELLMKLDEDYNEIENMKH